MEDVEQTTVVGVFTNNFLVERTLSDLQQAGFTHEQIGFAVRTKEAEPVDIAPVDARAHVRGATTGAVSGGVAGGLLRAAVALLIPGIGPSIAGGMLAALLSGTMLGAFAGGIVGALQDMGISEEEARYYEREMKNGHIIILVKADKRKQEALDIFHENCAYDAGVHFDNNEGTHLEPARINHYTLEEEYNPNIPSGATL